jgi:hypothetical protein
MTGPVSDAPPFSDRCYACDDPAFLEPAALIESPTAVRAVYRCGCGHVWNALFNTDALDDEYTNREVAA